MEDISDYLMSCLPEEPTVQETQFINSHKRIKMNAILYRVAWVPEIITGLKQKMIECKCTACEETFYQAYTSKSNGKIGFYDDLMQGVFSGESCLCPNCGAQVRAVHVSAFRHNYQLYELGCITFRLVGGYPALIQWDVCAELYKDGELRRFIKPYNCYIFVGKKTYYFRKWASMFGNRFLLREWEKHRTVDDIGEAEKTYVLKPDEEIFKDTPLENAKLTKYLFRYSETYPLAYIRCFLRHPSLENLVMQDHINIINSVFSTSSYSMHGISAGCLDGVIDFKDKRPFAMLGLTKDDYRYFRAEKWDYDMLTTFKLNRDIVGGIPAARFRDVYTELSRYYIGRVQEEGLDPVKVTDYLIKQRAKTDTRRGRITVTEYLDYLKLMRELGYRLETKEDYYPPKLLQMHDRLARESAERQAAAERKELEERAGKFAALAERYESFCFELNGLFIRIAETPDELVAEGAELHHCVASYRKKHATGASCIFFIRKAEQPNTPYYTLELNMSSLEVIQNRGKYNCDETEKVIEFKEAWLRFIKKAAKQKRKKAG